MLRHIGRLTEGEWPTNEIVDEGVTVHLARRMGQNPAVNAFMRPSLGIFRAFITLA